MIALANERISAIEEAFEQLHPRSASLLLHFYRKYCDSLCVSVIRVRAKDELP